MSVEQTDELGQRIIDAGFAPNRLLLDMNHSLCVPRDFTLEAPWNLPSRQFRFPIEVVAPEAGEPRKIGLMHPELAAHPFVKHVESVLGIEIARDGVANRYGYSAAPTARWWHSVDLISAGKWRELLATQLHTTMGDIFHAVSYGCRYSPNEDRQGRGYISTAEARTIMEEMGATEPEDAVAILLQCDEPKECKSERSTHWPINTGRSLCGEDQAWCMILGIEQGWFAHDRAGFLQWTENGRARYAAGDSATYTQASGQEAFAF